MILLIVCQSNRVNSIKTNVMNKIAVILLVTATLVSKGFKWLIVYIVLLMILSNSFDFSGLYRQCLSQIQSNQIRQRIRINFGSRNDEKYSKSSC